MAIRSDSYSSVEEVTAFTRHLLDGAAGFSNVTRPTLTEVERFIDRASAALNVALISAGFSIPITDPVGKILCDDWVTQRATEYTELTQRGVGYSDAEGSRTAYFANLTKRARTFVEENALGFARLGAGQMLSSSAPLFTGTNETLFVRGQFGYGENTDDD